MSMSFRVAAFPMLLMTALSACVGGGGGGGDGSSVVGEVPPSPPLPPSQTVVMPGISQTGGGANTGISFNLDPISDSNSTTTLTYDGAGNLTGLSLSAPQSSVSFGPGEISESFDDSGRRTAYVGVNATSLAIAMDPVYFGWNYQSFGVWLKDVSPTSFQAGAMSAGAITPAIALPTALTNATFSGHAGGFYFDGAGNRFATDAQMSAVTDFQNRNIQFSTTGTLLTDTATFATTSNPTLDLRGNWSYATGTSQFSGSVNTVDSTLTGSASGRFYGPNAEEIGGVYGLTGGGASMLGGFGGKR